MSGPVVTDAAASTDEVARRLFAAATRLPGVIRVGLALTAGAGRELTFTASDRRHRDSAVQWCRIDGLADVPLAQAVRSGEPVELGSAAELALRYPHLHDRQLALGTRALAAYPVLGPGAVLGGVLLAFDAPQPFDAAQRDQLRALTARTAQALDDVRRRARAPGRAGHGPRRLPELPGVTLARHHDVVHPPSPGARRTRDHGLGAGRAVGWVAAAAQPDGVLRLAAGRVARGAGGTGRPPEREQTRAVLDPRDRSVRVLSDGSGPVLVPGSAPGRLVAGEHVRLPAGGLVVVRGAAPSAGADASRVPAPGPAADPLEVHRVGGHPPEAHVSAALPPEALPPEALPPEALPPDAHPLEVCLRLAAGAGPGGGPGGGAVSVLAAAAGLPPGVRRCRAELPDEPGAARRARALLRERLAAWGAPELADAAQSCVSELVTNALIHAATAAQLDVQCDPRRLLVLLTDRGSTGRDAVAAGRPALPGGGPPPAAARDDVGGRGLVLVAALADRWGWRAGQHGTTVWFELHRG